MSRFHNFFLLWIALSTCPLFAKDNLELTIDALIRVDKPQVQLTALQGLKDGLRGLPKVKMPKNWEALESKYAKNSDPKMQVFLRELNQKFGSEKANVAALEELMNENNNVLLRRESLASLIKQKYKPLLPKLSELLNGPLVVDAIRAYSHYDSLSGAQSLLKRYDSFDSTQKQAVIETLATRRSYGQELLKALKQGSIKKNEIPAYVARSLRNLLGKDFNEIFAENKSTSSDKTALIAKYKALIHSASFKNADSGRGRSLFNRTCAACHKMYDFGGLIGPDLTGSNRADTDYILLNIIDPSFDVPDNYRMATIKSKSGQIFMGNIIHDDASSLTLKMIGQKQVVPKSEIANKTISKVSMMPEGLLNTLKDDEVQDLIKYLQTTKQVEAK